MTVASASRVIAPGLLTWPEEPAHLLGSRCDACGTVTFPSQDGCPRCGLTGMAVIELSREGTLWTWTSQEFLPKSPYAGPETADDFGGYLVGYVELPEGVRVIAHLEGVTKDEVRIGMAMELVVMPFSRDDDGTEVLAYAFRPVDGGT